MTPEDRTPRKRRRRRRRPSGEGQQTMNGNGGPQPGNEAQPSNFGGGGGGRRRKRQRHRRNGRGPVMPEASTPIPTDIPASELTPVSGILYIKANGGGLLVNTINNYAPQPGDSVVPRSVIERLHLQAGLQLTGNARRAQNGNLEMIALETVEGVPLEEYRESRRPFSELISIDPNQQFKLETEPERLTTRVLDLLSPIGMGQRCLVVAPPKAGKTTLLKDIAHGLNLNHPEVLLFVLLVDERPEEVTDFRRSVEKGEVIASSSDETAENHIHIAEVVLERARRLVEMKKDVVILCDSITRMSRAYNNEQRGSGKILSGGIDARTMEKPRRFFGAARNAEDWGSLTIIATALIDTGSRTPVILPKVHTLRRALAGTDPMTAMKMLLERLQKFPA